MRYSADGLYYEKVIVLGYQALFTNERIKRDTVGRHFVKKLSPFRFCSQPK